MDYKILDPKDTYIDNGVGQTIGYMQPSGTTSVSTSTSPSTSTTVTTSAGTIPNQYKYMTRSGLYTIGQQPNFASQLRSKENIWLEATDGRAEPDIKKLERMIDSLYA